MKKIKLNTAKLHLAKEKVADLTSDEMYKLQGGVEHSVLCPTGNYYGNPCYNQPEPTTNACTSAEGCTVDGSTDLTDNCIP
jgi:hypothetical protein